MGGWLACEKAKERPNQRQMLRSELYRSYYLVAYYGLKGNKQDRPWCGSHYGRHPYVMIYVPLSEDYSRTICAF